MKPSKGGHSAAVVLASLSSVAMADEAPLVVVPVVPEAAESHLSSSPVAPAPAGRARRQEKAEGAVTAPDLGPINAESVSPSEGRFADASPARTLSLLKGAEVSPAQDEGSALAVRFRGTRAFEPAFFWDGFPLSGVYGGAQTVELLPAPLLRGMDAYPDAPPWWFPMAGISGAIDFSPCAAIDCFLGRSDERGWKAGSSLALGSFGLWRFGSVAGARLGERSSLLSGIQVERSREDFPVRNDNGTPFRKDDDFRERRRNNDFARGMGGLVAGGAVPSWPGRWTTSLVGGSEERGLAGSMAARTTPRLSRSLVLSTARVERLFPGSGARQSLGLGALLDRTAVSYKGEKPVAFSPSASQAASIHVALRGSLPGEIVFPGVSGISLFLSHQAHRSRREGTVAEKLEASRMEGTPSLFRSWVPWETESLTVSTDLTLKANFARSSSNATCSQGGEGCGTPVSHRDAPLLSSVISVQAKLGGHVAFVRHARLQRRPWLREQAGEVGAVYPNASLKPETSREFEAGIGNPYAQIVCFAARDEQLIVLDAKSARDGRFENFDAVRRQGCVADAEVLLWGHLKPSASWRLTRASFTSPSLVGKKELPRTPRLAVEGSLGLEKVKLLGVSWDSQASARWRSPSYLDSSNQIRFAPPVRIDAGLSARWDKAFPPVTSMRVGLEALDLWQKDRGVETDGLGREIAADHGGFSGFPKSGRRFVLTLSLDW